LTPEERDELLDDLLTPEERDELLDDLLTPEERDELLDDLLIPEERDEFLDGLLIPEERDELLEDRFTLEDLLGELDRGEVLRVFEFRLELLNKLLLVCCGCVRVSCCLLDRVASELLPVASLLGEVVFLPSTLLAGSTAL
jgi:hypothetical protein